MYALLLVFDGFCGFVRKKDCFLEEACKVRDSVFEVDEYLGGFTAILPDASGKTQCIVFV